jgi:hypothetical protein
MKLHEALTESNKQGPKENKTENIKTRDIW